MITDARTLGESTDLHASVCVVGAGAAGITLARQMANTSTDLILLESGGFQRDRETQSLYRGEIIGFPYYPLEASRLRFFGGTTNIWDGLCRPLEEGDFEQRTWVPNSGWPISRQTMDPFYRQAHALCEIGRYDYDPAGWETSERSRLQLDGERIQTEMLQAGPPTKFGLRYREDIEKARNIRTLTHANVVEIETNSDGTEIVALRVATLEGGEFRVRAATYVLAAGAIETARLLLASNKVHRNGIGNERDLVGRYFMEHLHVPGGVFIPSDPNFDIGLYNWRNRSHIRRADDDAMAFGFLMPSPALQTREQISAVRVVMRPLSEAEAMKATSDSVYSFDWLIDEIVRRSRSNAAGRGDRDAFMEHMSRIIGDLDDLAIYGYRQVFRKSHFNGIYLVYSMEQAPNAESRVMLGDERDSLGMPRVKLDWRFTDLDRRTYDRFTRILAQELGKAGLGRLQTITDDPEAGWPMVREGLRGAWHQMGTTRMHSSPREGVVDENCRVHGISNLYIASSSVFATSGIANPTLTIVALAARVADHLKERSR